MIMAQYSIVPSTWPLETGLGAGLGAGFGAGVTAHAKRRDSFQILYKGIEVEQWTIEGGCDCCRSGYLLAVGQIKLSAMKHAAANQSTHWV